MLKEFFHITLSKLKQKPMNMKFLDLQGKLDFIAQWLFFIFSLYLDKLISFQFFFCFNFTSIWTKLVYSFDTTQNRHFPVHKQFFFSRSGSLFPSTLEPGRRYRCSWKYIYIYVSRDGGKTFWDYDTRKCRLMSELYYRSAKPKACYADKGK